eukprot:1814824-Pleurochrysis_carterae.AAC.1
MKKKKGRRDERERLPLISSWSREVAREAPAGACARATRKAAMDTGGGSCVRARAVRTLTRAAATRTARRPRTSSRLRRRPCNR